MNTTTLPDAGASLGDFLRDRRARLQPERSTGRRRTPGLRREEVATRAGVSVTWYTWLEQGRGGAASVAVLERLACALELDDAGREVLFLLAQSRPPPIRPPTPAPVPPAVQQVLDAMPLSPALVKTPTWDVVAWNAAAHAVLAPYDDEAPEERNTLRRLFSDPAVKAALPDWEAQASFAIATFRIDVARIGGSAEADALAAELFAASPDFRRLWTAGDAGAHGSAAKRIIHPEAGLLPLCPAAFALDGAARLTMIVMTPATPADAAKIEALLRAR